MPLALAVVVAVAVVSTVPAVPAVITMITVSAMPAVAAVRTVAAVTTVPVVRIAIAEPAVLAQSDGPEAMAGGYVDRLVPVIGNEHDRLAACLIVMAVPRPVPGVARGDVKVNGPADDGDRRRLGDHRLRIDHDRRR
ncbi:MAG: hypothetical protein ABWZ78_13730 [Burkholderiaceae bacterium]